MLWLNFVCMITGGKASKGSEGWVTLRRMWMEYKCNRNWKRYTLGPRYWNIQVMVNTVGLGSTLFPKNSLKSCPIFVGWLVIYLPLPQFLVLISEVPSWSLWCNWDNNTPWIKVPVMVIPACGNVPRRLSVCFWGGLPVFISREGTLEYMDKVVTRNFDFTDSWKWIVYHSCGTLSDMTPGGTAPHMHVVALKAESR